MAAVLVAVHVRSDMVRALPCWCDWRLVTSAQFCIAVSEAGPAPGRRCVNKDQEDVTDEIADTQGCCGHLSFLSCEDRTYLVLSSGATCMSQYRHVTRRGDVTQVC